MIPRYALDGKVVGGGHPVIGLREIDDSTTGSGAAFSHDTICRGGVCAWLNACKKYLFGPPRHALPRQRCLPGEKNDSDKKAMNEQCFECLGILE